MIHKNTLLKRNVIQGFGTLIIREFFIKFFSFLGQLFLARILFPSDFGVYAIIVFIVSFSGLFADIGLSLAIIQKKEEPTHSELSTIFNIKILLTLVIISLIWMLAPFIKVFYSSFNDVNIEMVRIFSLTLIFISLRIIPISLLERKIKYNFISLLDVLGVFVYYVTALYFAFNNFGVWSFIFASFAKEISETIVIYILQPFIPSFSLNISKIKEMIKFGVFIQGNGLINFVNSSIVPIMGGVTGSSVFVGYLDFAKNISSFPQTIAVNFGRVAFAGYSRIQNEKNLLTKSIEESMGLLSIIFYIFPVIIIGFGQELIRYIFTDKWLPASPALLWFSAGVFFLPVIASLGQVILSIGKSKEIFRITLLTTFISWIIAFYLIQSIGFTGIAVADFTISLLLSFLYAGILFKSNFKINYFKILSKKVLSASITLVICYLLNLTLPNSFYFLVIKIILTSLVYLVLIYTLEKQELVKLLNLIFSFIKSKHD